MILIRIQNMREWSPLSRSRKIKDLYKELSTDEIMLVEKNFAEYISNLLSSEIAKAIRTQRFPRRYAPLSPKYLEWKRKNRRKLGFWQSSEFLMDSIDYWFEESDGAWVVGVPSNLIHPDNKTPVETIIMTLEQGSRDKNIPPRPLFIPIANNISKSIMRHFIVFLRVYNKEYLQYLR